LRSSIHARPTHKSLRGILSRRQPFSVLILLILSLLFMLNASYSTEIFIYRPDLEKKPLSTEKKITLHGEIFGHLQYPSTFPSYNDLSGPEDRWNFGFKNIIFLTPDTVLHAQLVTHDDGQRRTKFDWHFSLRQKLLENLVLIIGHDSNHDSDHQSILDGKSYFLNRNYVGFGIPFKAGDFYLEPFTWFFHHTNQRTHLDFSGEKLAQEFGLRMGVWIDDRFGIHVQIFSQLDSIFSHGRAYMADVILRLRLLDYFELSAGTRFWKDINESPDGNKQNFYKFFWGIAIPF